MSLQDEAPGDNNLCCPNLRNFWKAKSTFKKFFLGQTEMGANKRTHMSRKSEKRKRERETE